MIKNITVIGSGTMGNGIAHTFSQHGFKVSLVDINSESLTRAIQTINGNLDRQIKKEVIDEDVKIVTLNNISTFTDLNEGSADADLVIEAATENQDIKLKLFMQLSDLCKEEVILASNT